MASLEEIIELWRHATEVNFSTVKNALVSRGFELASNKGSHFVFRHPLIIEAYGKFPEYFHRDFGPDGSLVIVQHKKKVKRIYLKRAADALQILRDIEEFEKEYRR